MIAGAPPSERLRCASEYIVALTDAVALADKADMPSTHEIMLNLIREQALIVEAVAIDLDRAEQ